MYEYRFFIDYPEWRAQFERDIWHEPYHIQQLRLFMFELFLVRIARPLAPTLTWELAREGMDFFYGYLLTDNASLIAEQWPSLLFWFGESGSWKSELHPRKHLQQIQQYVESRRTDCASHDIDLYYPIQYALLLMEHGLPARQLASPRAWELLSHEIGGGMGEDWADELYLPPHLIWRGEMYHNCGYALPQSSFLYPKSEHESQ